MTSRFRTEKNSKDAETIYRLRQGGLNWQEIAYQVGMSYHNARHIYQRECLYRKQAFYYPFIEYLSARAEKAIRKSLGQDLLAHPETLCHPDNLKKLICWPGVGSIVLQNLADGLAQAGYESFDPQKTKETLFSRPKPFRRLNTPVA